MANGLKTRRSKSGPLETIVVVGSASKDATPFSQHPSVYDFIEVLWL